MTDESPNLAKLIRRGQENNEMKEIRPELRKHRTWEREKMKRVTA